MNKLSVIVMSLASVALVVSGCLKKPVTPPVNQNQNINTATTTSEIDMSDWKTYRNDEYGFEFKYPKDWTMYQQTEDPMIKFSVGFHRFGDTQKEGTEISDGAVFIVKILGKEDLLKRVSLYPAIYKFQKSQFKNFDALVYKGNYIFGDDILVQDSSSQVVFFVAGNKLFEVESESIGPNYQNYSKDILSVLDSFRLTKE